MAYGDFVNENGRYPSSIEEFAKWHVLEQGNLDYGATVTDLKISFLVRPGGHLVLLDPKLVHLQSVLDSTVKKRAEQRD
jgi:hypothetical protein